MCGIAGQVLFDKKKGFTKEQSVNAIALLSNLQKRGGEAWGFYLEKAKNNTHLYCGKKVENMPGEVMKMPDTPTKFFKEGSIIYFTDVHTFLMHTRQHTKGLACYNENNHPFVTKNFVLAHNGSVYNDTEVIHEFKIETTIECDSYALVALIQHFFDQGKTVLESIRAMSRALRGNYACWLYHKDTKDLYLFRNSTSPLSYFLDEKNQLMVFASTEENIMFAYDDKNMSDQIKELTQGEIYKFEDNQVKMIGKLETPVFTNSNSGRSQGAYNKNDFNTGIVENATSNFEFMFDFLEKYETEEEDNTIIGITPQGEVQILVRPAIVIKTFDDNGLAKYKSNQKLYDSAYTEYDLPSIEAFNKAIEEFRNSLDGDEEDDDDDDVNDKSKSTKSPKMDDPEFNTALHDLADMIDCKVMINGHNITFRYVGGGEIPPDIKKMFKKVGLHFRNEKKLVIKNNKHHHLSLLSIMKKLTLQQKKPKTTIKPTTETKENDDDIPTLISTEENPTTMLTESGIDVPTGEDA
jgi:hypothetical protein